MNVILIFKNSNLIRVYKSHQTFIISIPLKFSKEKQQNRFHTVTKSYLNYTGQLTVQSVMSVIWEVAEDLRNKSTNIYLLIYICFSPWNSHSPMPSIFLCCALNKCWSFPRQLDMFCLTSREAKPRKQPICFCCNDLLLLLLNVPGAKIDSIWTGGCLIIG